MRGSRGEGLQDCLAAGWRRLAAQRTLAQERIPMTSLLNAAYLLGLFVLSPWLAYKSLTTGKYRRGLWRKLAGSAVLRQGNTPCAWFHGVSVGEIHLLRQVVARFREGHPNWHCAISTTTDTGFD